MWLQSTLADRDTSLYRSVFITSLGELPGHALPAALVEKIGRRLTILLMYSSAFIFLLPLTFPQREVITTSLLFGARVCVTGIYSQSSTYCAELYPTSVRATGMGMTNVMGKMESMASPLVAVWVVSRCHQMAAVASFEFVFVVAAACIAFFAVETRGRTLTDTVS